VLWKSYFNHRLFPPVLERPASVEGAGRLGSWCSIYWWISWPRLDKYLQEKRALVQSKENVG
ncbi:unnamed protein product, partial [Arabidopsis halleri]